jgi:hypothetical protein
MAASFIAIFDDSPPRTPVIYLVCLGIGSSREGVAP